MPFEFPSLINRKYADNFVAFVFVEKRIFQRHVDRTAGINQTPNVQLDGQCAKQCVIYKILIQLRSFL